MAKAQDTFEVDLAFCKERSHNTGVRERHPMRYGTWTLLDDLGLGVLAEIAFRFFAVFVVSSRRTA